MVWLFAVADGAATTKPRTPRWCSKGVTALTRGKPLPTVSFKERLLGAAVCGILLSATYMVLVSMDAARPAKASTQATGSQPESESAMVRG